MSERPDYSAVEQMLFRGFISSPANLGGVPIVFKSLNQVEQDLIRLYSYDSDFIQSSNLHAAYLISNSIYLFNRVCVFWDREDFTLRMVDAIMEWPEALVKRVLYHLKTLNNKAYEAIFKVEGYSYGVESRQKWEAYRGLSLNSTAVTGIPHSEVLGLNLHQRLWVHYNTVDDLSRDYDRHWSLAKFQASVHNSKEVQKIDREDRKRRREEEERRKSIHEGYHMPGTTTRPSGEIKVSQESVDDLLGEMHKNLSGQKDFHDLVIEQHEKRVRDTFLKKQREIERRRAESRQRLREVLPEESEDPFVFYDEETLEQLSRQKKQQRREALLRGDYASEGDRLELETRLKKWGVLEGDDQTTHAPKTGSLLDDYYTVEEPNLPSKGDS